MLHVIQDKFNSSFDFFFFYNRAVFKWLSKVTGWRKNCTSVFQPMRSKTKTKTKTNHILYAWFFPRFEKASGNCLKLELVHRVVCSCCVRLITLDLVFRQAFEKRSYNPMKHMHNRQLSRFSMESPSFSSNPSLRAPNLQGNSCRVFFKTVSFISLFSRCQKGK